MKYWTIIFAFAVLLTACDKGEPLANQAPDTKISLTQINLTGTDRLASEVTLYWSGTDVDGYVEGFEISFDNTNWSYVTSQDSTFNFSLSAGSDTTDIDFYVRAIDNEGLSDPSPAYLLIPIRNSAPVVKFDSTQAVNDTTYVVSTFVWSATDPDGNETLDSLYVRLNSGPWVALETNITLMSLIPTNTGVTGVTDCEIYAGDQGTLLPYTLPGLNLNGDNRLYLKARDNAGEESDLDSTKVFFVKPQTSDLLLINANSGGSSPTPDEVYFPIISTVYGSFDYINIIENSQENIPSLWNPTFLFMMNLYDKVFLYSDESTLPNTDLILEGLGSILPEFLNKGGKMLVSSKFPADLDEFSTIFGFSPMDSLSSSSGQARITTDSLLVAQPGFVANYPDLAPSAFITGADPFYISNQNDVIYKAQLTPVSGWVGPDNIAARTRVASGTNQVFFSVELHKMNGDPQALQDMFDYVLNTEFNW